MILLFLGNWRSTLIIAVSIPLSILTSIMVLSFLGETINIMTLGGLALAVGILVDDATVDHREHRAPPGGRAGAATTRSSRARPQIAVPAFVSTLCICIVFVPMFFLTGVARFLFVPLAEAVVFAMLASYFLSRTLVPTLVMYCCSSRSTRGPSRNPLARFQRVVRARVRARCAPATGACSTALVSRRRASSCRVFLLALPLRCLLLLPLLGAGLLPDRRHRPVQPAPARQDRHPHRGDRAPRRPGGDVDPAARSRARSCDTILDNIGLPYSSINYMYSHSGPSARRRRHPGVAQGRPPARPRTTCARCARELPQRVSRA